MASDTCFKKIALIPLLACLLMVICQAGKCADTINEKLLHTMIQSLAATTLPKTIDTQMESFLAKLPNLHYPIDEEQQFLSAISICNQLKKQKEYYAKAFAIV